MCPTRFDDNNDDETPLLRVQSGDIPRKRTPLPTTQISVLVFPWIAESLVYNSIGPYINQVRLLIRHLTVHCR